MARNGKIARLPLHIRNELNKKLSDGESGVKLVKWVNEEVRFYLRDSDESRRLRITEQNLSEWRQGGYQDWLRHEEARQFLKDMAEQAGEMDKAADGKGITDRFGALLAVDLARLAKKFLEQETDDEKRWARLKEISKELSRLRRDEHRAMCTWIKREQWEWRREREERTDKEERSRKEEQRERIEALFGLTRAKSISAMEGGKKVSGLRVQGSGPKAHEAAAGTAAPRGESDQIQPNPTKNVTQSGPAGTLEIANNPDIKAPANILERRAFARHEPKDLTKGQNPSESDQIKVNQTKPVGPGLPSEGTNGEAGLTIKVEGTGFALRGRNQVMPTANAAVERD